MEKTSSDAVDLDFDVISTDKDVALLAVILNVDVEHEYFVAIEHLSVSLLHLCVVYQVPELRVDGGAMLIATSSTKPISKTVARSTKGQTNTTFISICVSL